jgi:hypothetical protein
VQRQLPHGYSAWDARDADRLRTGTVVPAQNGICLLGDALLLGRLIARIRRALSAKHLMNGSLRLQIANQVVRGRIEWDDAHDGRLPMLIIDGWEVTWEDFGSMLMSFEGFHFQLNIRDKSEEF